MYLAYIERKSIQVKSSYSNYQSLNYLHLFLQKLTF